MAPQDECKLQLEVFEGPLDLLLYLIRKDEVEVFDIRIEQITNQYMEYLGLMQMLDLNIAGEFLVMAATLLMIKSRMLLPEDERPALEEEEEDPRWDLVRQLLEYKKFKDAAMHLEERALRRDNMFDRGMDEASLEPEPSLTLQEVSIFDLITALNEALKRVQQEDLGEIFAEQFTVGDKIEEIINVLRATDRIRLNNLFERMRSRLEIVCTFLAVLELIRLRQINVSQSESFGEIWVNRAESGLPTVSAPARAASDAQG